MIEFGCGFKVCVWSEEFRGLGKSNIGGASAGCLNVIVSEGHLETHMGFP